MNKSLRDNFMKALIYLVVATILVSCVSTETNIKEGTTLNKDSSSLMDTNHLLKENYSAPANTPSIRSIDIQKVLNSAKNIQNIIVFDYNDSIMFYGIKNKIDTLKINCKIRKDSEKYRFGLIEKNRIEKTNLAGKWPDIGQEVLIVIDQNNKVSLFATKLKNDNVYRFWDPNSNQFSTSIFSIIMERPYLRLYDCADKIEKNSKYWTCTDGCLMIATDMHLFKNYIADSKK
jgi:hypothetical protein